MFSEESKKVINDMALTTSFMGLRVWNQLLDDYDHEQLADNWAKIDNHDHTPGRGVQITTQSIADGSITYPLTASGSLGLAVGSFMANTSSQSLSAHTATDVKFTNKAWDISEWFDIVTNVGRYTPKLEGYYRLNATIFVEEGEGLQIIIYKNGSPLIYSPYGTSVAALGSAAVNTLVHANGSTDYFEVFAVSPISTKLTGAKCYFCGELVGLG